jgi:hypothetical protein
MSILAAKRYVTASGLAIDEKRYLNSLLDDGTILPGAVIPDANDDELRDVIAGHPVAGNLYAHL